MPIMYIRKTPSEVRYYFDLTINESILILHQILHEIDEALTKRFMNFTLEQVKAYYLKGENRKFTLTILISNKRLNHFEIVEEIKKMPYPIKSRKR